MLIKKSLNKTNNQKKDIKNKIVSKLVNTYETICIQDENIKEWQEGYFGKQVHDSILGGIMSGLKSKSHALNIVNRYTPTTQPCPICLKLNKISLNQREYSCECGYRKSRDSHSGFMIQEIAMGRIDPKKFHKDIKVCTEHTHCKSPMERVTSTGNGLPLPASHSP